ncbi:MAG: hypothetical protein J6W04_02690 [Bacteroidales bacterium]|nr:hypothetical protein [Bacteroidales bacterium]
MNDTISKYEIVIEGHVLPLEDQIAMCEAWESGTPWYEAKMAELLALLAERDGLMEVA